METENTVSIWVGNFASREELDNYIDLRYDDDGEIVSSKFYDAFQIDIDDIDDYLIEKEYCDSRFSNVYDHIIGASYADVVIDNLKKIEDDLAIPEIPLFCFIIINIVGKSKSSPISNLLRPSIIDR